MRNLLFILILIGLVACNSKKKSSDQQVEDDKIVVTAVNYPLYYFAQRIGGDVIDVKYEIPNDVDPAYWVPESENLLTYQNSDIVFTNGANYAKWLNNVSLPQRLLVNTSAGAKDKYIEIQEGASHSHGAEGEHVHTGFAFTTWLDFSIAIEQATSIKNELSRLMPENSEMLDQNYNKLKAELTNLDEQLKSISSSDFIIGSHPVYQYLAKAYNLHMHSVHFEPGEMPTHDQWHELDHLLDHHASKIMLWEAEPIDEIKAELMNRNIKIIVYNPCGNKPEQGDFLSVMKKNIEVFTQN